MAKSCVVCGNEAVVGTCNYCDKSVCEIHLKEADIDSFCPHCFGQL